jgi:hypothetical protein
MTDRPDLLQPLAGDEPDPAGSGMEKDRLTRFDRVGATVTVHGSGYLLESDGHHLKSAAMGMENDSLRPLFRPPINSPSENLVTPGRRRLSPSILRIRWGDRRVGWVES